MLEEHCSSEFPCSIGGKSPALCGKIGTNGTHGYNFMNNNRKVLTLKK